MPELIPTLREDVEQALAMSGGKFTTQSMQHMKKVDSFLKENMRLFPLGVGE
jgi:hypothetical protein